MIFRRESLTVYSTGYFYTENVTDQVNELVGATGVHEGIVNVLLRHTTGAMVLMEHEAGVLADIRDALERFLPPDLEMYHHDRGVDRNGHAHVLSSLFNGSLSIPVESGAIVLGEYQDIVFIDFQPERNAREITVTIMGEPA